MTAFATSCDPKRLQRLLDDQLPDGEQSLVTDHVGQCATCRTHLEELAAQRSWWREAARSLRSSQWRDDGSLTLAPRDVAQAEDAASEAGLTPLDFLQPSDNPALLGQIGAYEILEAIGSGGFGIVLKGYDRELNRYVAVKVLSPHLAHSAAARKRFAREAQAAAAIVHPHVVPIHAVDGSGRLPYLVMPYIAGESLQQRIDRVGPLELKEVLRIGMQAAAGLAAAHAQGLVHRDIKPANILLEHGVDRVLLTDFGLARAMDDASLTRSTVIAGTPQYMSPEQARGEAIDSRTDLFSLGSVLYAMCAGHPPFRAETMLGVLRRVSEESPRAVRELNADVPDWLATILDRLLDKSAERRFQSAADVARLLEQCLAHVQQPTGMSLPAELRSMGRRRSARTWAARTGIAVAVAGCLAVAGYLARYKIDRLTPTRAGGVVTPAAEIDSPVSSARISEPVPAWNDSAASMELLNIEAGIQRLEGTGDKD